MPAGAVTPAAETHNLTEQRAWFSQDNQTEPCVKERLDSAGCLFVSILPYGQEVTALICTFVLLTVFSFLVNMLTLFGLRGSEDLSWQPRFTFLKNLIWSDLIQITTFGPAIIHSLVQRRTMAFGTWCYVQYFVGTASIFSSLITITCMALERYLYVCHAIHYLVILTQKRLRGVLILIWLYSISVGVINMVLLHSGRGNSNGLVTRGLLCEPDIVEQHLGFPRASAIYRKVVGSFTLLLCLLVHAVSYARMYQDARNAVIPFKAVNTTARKTVLFYCAMLLLQLLPLLLKVGSDALWEVGGTTVMMGEDVGDPQVKSSLSATAVVFHLSLLMMLFVPPCVNPLVHGLRNREVRQALLSLPRWCTDRVGTDVLNIELQNRARDDDVK